MGASLLAIAVDQSHRLWLTHRYREQARSHIKAFEACDFCAPMWRI
ncbi:hypothetical protein NHG95_18425 [Pseudomonas corrugata]|nr:hypothetical protein [Pseudomonas corrugata]MDU9035124.1 hypothetical protein [Pseudomonas corrugata]